MPNARPVAVIAALEQEAHALVRRMPRSESVGPRLSIWEGGGLVVMVAGVGLFVFRTKMRSLYGISEAAVGLAIPAIKLAAHTVRLIRGIWTFGWPF